MPYHYIICAGLVCFDGLNGRTENMTYIYIYKQNQCFSTHKPTCISKVVSKCEVSLIKEFVFYRCNQQSPKLLNKGYDISNRHMKKNIHQKCLKLAMKYKGNVSRIKTSQMSAKICKITFPEHGANS